MKSAGAFGSRIALWIALWTAAAAIIVGVQSNSLAAKKQSLPLTLVADFVMTRQIQALAQEVESRGIIYLGQPGQLRFEVNKPSPSVLVLNKGRASISYPEMGVTRRFDVKSDPAMQVLADHMLALSTFDEEAVAQHYEVLSSQEGVHVLIPKAASMLEYFSQMRVKMLDKRAVDWVEMTSRNGDVTRIAFANQRFGTQLDAQLFAVE